MRTIIPATVCLALAGAIAAAVAQDGADSAPAAAPAVSADWPSWGGPRGDFTTAEKGLLETWPEGGPKELWRRPDGPGYASPVAADGRVYLFSAVDGKDTLACLNAEDGTELWRQAGQGSFRRSHPGTRASPLIEGDRIYTFGGLGDLICRELADGKEVWTLDVLKETGTKMPMWGCASNPTIVGDLLYVQTGTGAGSMAVAVDKKSGRIAWQSEEKTIAGSYARIVPARIDGRQQMLAFGGKAVVAMDPQTGKTLWKVPWSAKFDINAVSPLYHDGHLFITSGYGAEGAGAMYKLDGDKAEQLWKRPDPHDRFVPPLLEGEHLYVANEGSLLCLRWPDGKELWRNEELRLGLGGGYTRYGDRMIMLADNGTLLLVRATPAECRLLGKVKLFGGSENWSTPLVYRSRLYVKGTDALVCMDFKGR